MYILLYVHKMAQYVRINMYFVATIGSSQALQHLVMYILYCEPILNYDSPHFLHSI